MSQSINQIQQSQTPGLGKTTAATAAAPSGRGFYRGQAVARANSPTASLQEAAEELTFGHSEEVEKKLHKRKLKGKRSAKSFAMEQAERYLKKVPDLERHKRLAAFVESILSEGAKDPGKLQERAREFSPDVTHQFIALTHARDQAREQGASVEVIAGLNQALEQLEKESGKEIQAGLNVSEVAQNFSSEALGETQDLRDFYRNVALDYSSTLDAYDKITEKYANENLPDAVHFLLESLSADLQANNQSISKVQLKLIMDDMYQLKLLNTMHSQCDTLINRMQKQFKGTRIASTSTALVRDLLMAKDQGWKGASFFADILDKLHIGGRDEGTYFLQGFKEVLREVPLKVFDDDNLKRSRLLQAIQQQIDTLVYDSQSS